MIHARIADSNVCLTVPGSKIPRATRKTCAENAGPWRELRGKARDLLAPVYGWFTGGFNTLDLKEASLFVR